MTFDKFLELLKSMEYLDPSVVVYPSEFAMLLKEEIVKNEKSSENPNMDNISKKLDGCVGFIALTVLLQYSYTRQNICIMLKNESLKDIVEKMSEQYISNNYRSKFFLKSDNPEELRCSEEERFSSIWNNALLQKNNSDLFSFVPESFLLRICAENVNEETCGRDASGRVNFLNAPFVLYDNSHLYYARLYNEETFIAEYIKNNGKPGTGLIWGNDNSPEFKQCIRSYLDILFSENTDGQTDYQKIAVAASCISNFSIITGGPGTGKTTTVVKLLLLMECLFAGKSEKLMISLAAPTGKASNRMKESILGSLDRFKKETGDTSVLRKLSEQLKREKINLTPDELCASVPTEASTIHKLVGISPSGYCRYNHDNPLSCNVIIIDEASMLDIENFYNLLRALKQGCKVILLGDQNQLPSVEAGSVFGDLCKAFLDGSRKISEYLKDFLPENFAGDKNISDNAVRLVKSHRFDDSKGIGKLAVWVNNGGGSNADGLFETFKGDFQDLEKTEGRTFGIKIENFPGNGDTLSRLKTFLWDTRGYKRLWTLAGNITEDLSLEDNREKARELFSSFDYFRVLCTNRETVFGVKSVNQIYEDIFLKNSKNKARWRRSGAVAWYPGLPVMINVNNYALNLFNGDIGITLRDPYSSDENELRVLFRMSDGSYRYYPTSVLSDFEPAYAMTIHKSQGSEADHVLILSQEKDSSFITREILYTGITRARKTVTMVYDPEILQNQSKRQIMRCSNLEQRLF